jgi:hypothetical protein
MMTVARGFALIYSNRPVSGLTDGYNFIGQGEIFKVRLFESVEEAQRVYRLRVGLEEAFAPALGCEGRVLIEKWIDGVPLADIAWEAWVEPAGALLGRLHSRPLPADEPPTVSTRRWLDGAESDLDILTTAGTLEAGEAAHLRDELRHCDPGNCRTVVIHTDFCADNMLIDTAGRLRVIDGASLCALRASISGAFSSGGTERCGAGLRFHRAAPTEAWLLADRYRLAEYEFSEAQPRRYTVGRFVAALPGGRRPADAANRSIVFRAWAASAYTY